MESSGSEIQKLVTRVRTQMYQNPDPTDIQTLTDLLEFGAHTLLNLSEHRAELMAQHNLLKNQYNDLLSQFVFLDKKYTELDASKNDLRTRLYSRIDDLEAELREFRNAQTNAPQDPKAEAYLLSMALREEINNPDPKFRTLMHLIRKLMYYIEKADLE